MSCKCAIRTDEYHGWECDITGGSCMFLLPNSKACAEKYGEGPDANSNDSVDLECDECLCPDCKSDCENAGQKPGTCSYCEDQVMYDCGNYIG